MEYILIAIFALLGGTLQSITGFGSAIVMMLILPSYFSMPVSAAVSSAICIFLTGYLVIKNRKEVKPKEIILPLLLYSSVCIACISLSLEMDSAIIKKCFGGFLVLLALYYFFFKSKSDKPIGIITSVIFIATSGACSAFFGIGGPLMALYFTSRIPERKEFIATSQLFFLSTGSCNLIFRIYRGIIGVSELKYVLFGAVAIVIGALIGSKIASKLKPEILKKITYITIAICGVLNIFK